MSVKSILFSTSTIAGAVMLAGSANAAPIGAGSLSAGVASFEKNIVQVQMRRGVRGAPRVAPRVGARPGGFRGGGGRVVRGGRRGIGGVGAAAIGLGVLGAAIAAGAAANAAPPPAECWIERQPVYDNWGNFRGYRRVRVCQ